MQVIIIKERESGQRLDKFLGKLMPKASKSFYYKMLRKKNITLNGKKAQGGEHLEPGDEIKLFLSEETIEKFSGKGESRSLSGKPLPGILYEDEDVLFFNKPQGLLSQKGKEGDISAVELLEEYCLKTGRMTEEDLKRFRPALCNRLDRNTSGIVACGLSIKGLQAVGELLRGREVGKYYRCVVAGTLKEAKKLSGFLKKEEKTNRVAVFRQQTEGASFISTEYRPLKTNGSVTYLEVKLNTGKSHQIRAHLASVGHPVIGDPKYGQEETNRNFRNSCQVKHQLLHAYRMVFPGAVPGLPALSGMVITAPVPEVFQRVLKKEGLEEG